jgi:2'-5' RNA ligase
VRLFVAVDPPPHVLDAIAALARPARERTRWTTRDLWHVTLRFLGVVEDPAQVVDALATMPPPGPVVARLGPRAEALGRDVVCLPVDGLGELAAAVSEATAAIGRPPDQRPYRGHLTLARVRDGRARALARSLGLLDSGLVWDVAGVLLVRSTLEPAGATHEVLHRHALADRSR